MLNIYCCCCSSKIFFSWQCCNFSLFPSTIPLPWFNTHPFFYFEIIWTSTILELIPIKSLGAWLHLWINCWLIFSFFFFLSAKLSQLLKQRSTRSLAHTASPLGSCVLIIKNEPYSVPAYCMDNYNRKTNKPEDPSKRRHTQFCPLTLNHTNYNSRILSTRRHLQTAAVWGNVLWGK